jgi:hypothetical protein
MATVARYDAYDERKLEQPAEEIKLMNYRDYLIYMRCSKQPSYSLWATWLSIYHRRIIKNFQFSLHKRGEECNCWHKLPLAAQTIAVSNQVLYHWFQRSDSMSRPMKRGAEFFEFIPPAKEAVDFWKEHNEPELANMYWEVYFSALIQITTECARDIPEYMSEINEFMHEIEANKHTAIQRGHSALLLPIHSKSWWNALRSTDSPMVMYGYGRNGKNLLPWLRYFQIPIAEIWDQSAPREGSDINGVPFRRMHGRFAGGETQILCSIEDRKVYLPVQRELRLLGYERFIPYDVLQYAVRYKIFERFTPFLLWDYTDQTYAIWGEEQ